MTDEELDRARAAEATKMSATGHWKDIAILAARLAREGWVPIDPDLIEAREMWAQDLEADGCLAAAAEARASARDDTLGIQLCLAGIKRGRELARKEAGK